MLLSTKDLLGATRLRVCGTARNGTGVRDGTARDGVFGSARNGAERDVMVD